MSSWSSHSLSSPDSTTVALQISVIRKRSKCLFHSGRRPRSCMCQHLEGDITLNAWLATSIGMASETLGKQNWWLSACSISTMGWDGALLLLRLWCWCLRYEFVSYRLSSKLWRIVINVSDSDDSSGCVGEAVHGVALHVSGLDDQRVLRHFLEGRTREATAGFKTQFFNL